MDTPAGTMGEGACRYAVVGLGHIAQAAVLPAFKHAKENSRLTALVSDDPRKLKKLAKKYDIGATYSYDQYDACLSSGEVDAVYIALPNHLHRDYAVRAAQAGVHVLCEKPMAITAVDCREMIDAARQADVRLMIAYRLHFEEANLEAAEIIRSGAIGEPRYFTSTFSMQVKAGDIRLQQQTGGGVLYDIGIYCINAARYLFEAEPVECQCWAASGADPRFAEVDEMNTVVLRFPDDRLASFTASFGASDTSSYRVVGTEGDLRVEPAYEYAGKLAHHLTVKGKTKKKTFPKRDQFAPELIYFSECVRSGGNPEPSGEEGLIDVKIIEALYRSMVERGPVALDLPTRMRRPSMAQEIHAPAVKEPELVHTESPSM
jgi:glucose-fructose oxidoreductase